MKTNVWMGMLCSVAIAQSALAGALNEPSPLSELRMSQRSKPKNVTMEGTLSCGRGDHDLWKECDLHLTAAGVRKPIDLRGSPSLLANFRRAHREMRARVEGAWIDGNLLQSDRISVNRWESLESSGASSEMSLSLGDQVGGRAPAGEESVTPLTTGGTLGRLRCESRKYRPEEIVQVNFIPEGNDASEIKVSSPSREIKALCPQFAGEKRVRVDGEKTSRFLLWGGNLKISKFSVEGT